GSIAPGQFLDETSKEQSEVLTPGNGQGTGSPLVQIAENYVVIHAANAAEPKVMALQDQIPYRIVLDYPVSAFGIAPSADGKAYAGEVAGIGNIVKVRYALNDPATLRFVIEVKSKAQFNVNTGSDGKITKVTVNAQASSYKIVIDAGHGGKDPGATGFSGRYEKHFTLELAEKVRALIAKEPLLEPYMVRDDDTFVELDDRAAFANDIGADLFISIHGNTFTQQI